MDQIAGDTGGEALALVKDLLKGFDSNLTAKAWLYTQPHDSPVRAFIARARELHAKKPLGARPSFDVREVLGARSTAEHVRVRCKTTSGRELVLDMPVTTARTFAGVLLEAAAPA